MIDEECPVHVTRIPAKARRIDREKSDLWVKINGKIIYRKNYSSEEQWRFAVKRLSRGKSKQ